MQLRIVPQAPPGAGAVVVSAALDRELPGSLRGHLDLCSADAVEGWAVDLDGSGKEIALELMVGQRVMARCRTSFARTDLQAPGVEPANAGFRFPRHALQALRFLLSQAPDERVTVRFAGTELFLPSAGTTRTLGEFFAPGDGEQEGFNLVVRLSELRKRSEAMLGLPLRATSPSCQGFLETVAVDEAGGVWVMGWMRRRTVVDCSVVVVDRQKITGALSFTWYARPDLDSEAAGFIGLLSTEWRPTRGSEAVIFLESDEGPEPVHLRIVAPLRLIAFRDFSALLEEQRHHCQTERIRALWQILRRPDFWSCHAAAEADVQAAVDQAIIIPGFGCVASGWVLSRFRHVERLSMRVGTAVMTLDPASLCVRPRPDLASAFPNLSALTNAAGFVCVLRGNVSDRDLDLAGQGGVVLKAMFERGTASNHPVDTHVLHRLGRGMTPDGLLDFYPGLETESFFPDLARAVLADLLQGGMRPIRPHAVKPFPNVVVFPVPDERSNLFLLVEEIHRARRMLGDETGFVLVAGYSACRPDITALFGEIAAFGSLFFVEDMTQLLHALPAILTICGAERFAFFGQNIFPTGQGWRVVGALGEHGAEIEALDPVDPVAAEHEEDAGRTLACFAWNKGGLTSWAAEAPMLLGGTVRTGLPLLPAVRHARAAVRGDADREARLTAAINQFAHS